MSVSPKSFELYLVDLQAELCACWKESFRHHSNVHIYNCRFEEINEYDCIVSPANSYGLMDGGIDLAIRNYYGMRVQYNVQKVIKKKYYGEQPVGTSIIALTEHEEHPFIAHTPTMRVPMDISNTDNVYNAMFAMLRAVANFNKDNAFCIKRVLCPGLGTATGKVAPNEAARQMALAYAHFMKPTSNMNWENLIERNNLIKGIKHQ